MTDNTIDELRNRVEQLEQRTDRLAQGAIDAQGRHWSVADFLNLGLSRRQALTAIAAIASGATLGVAIQQSIGVASADASTSDGDGDVGLPGDRVDVYADGVDANSVSADTATINSKEGIGVPTSPNTPALSLDSWRQASATRPAFVTLYANSKTDGTSAGTLNIEIDFSGGTTADYSEIFCFADTGLGNNGLQYAGVSFLLPTGAQYRIVNTSDPTGANQIQSTQELVL